MAARFRSGIHAVDDGDVRVAHAGVARPPAGTARGWARASAALPVRFREVSVR